MLQYYWNGPYKGSTETKETSHMLRFTGRPFCTAAVLIISLCGCSSEPGRVPRQELEEAYVLFTNACKKGDMAAVRKRSSSYWFASVRNGYVSQGKEFSGAQLAQMVEHFPGLHGKDFVKVLQRGPTAGLLYAAESAEPDAGDKPRVTFTFVKFVNEDSGWKFHGAMEMDSTKHQKDGSLTEFTPDDLPAHLAIDGEVPEAPTLIAEPEVVGVLDVVSYGYSTEVFVNSKKQSVTADSSSSGVIRGGLRKGENSLRVVVRRTRKEPLETPAVTIRAAEENGKLAEVFKFAPAKNAVGEHDEIFIVNLSTGRT